MWYSAIYLSLGTGVSVFGRIKGTCQILQKKQKTKKNKQMWIYSNLKLAQWWAAIVRYLSIATRFLILPSRALDKMTHQPYLCNMNQIKPEWTVFIKVTHEVQSLKFSYQILQLNKDDLSVWAQYFFIVASTLRTSVGQQENHQDITE